MVDPGPDRFRVKSAIDEKLPCPYSRLELCTYLLRNEHLRGVHERFLLFRERRTRMLLEAPLMGRV